MILEDIVFSLIVFFATGITCWVVWKINKYFIHSTKKTSAHLYGFPFVLFAADWIAFQMLILSYDILEVLF